MIDADGLLCPLPVLRLRKALQGVAVGGVVTLWADDPVAVVDVPHFCAQAGHAVLSVQDRGAGQTFVIRRGPDQTGAGQAQGLSG